MAKTWKQKMVAKHEPHVEVLERSYAGVPIGGKLFIATPELVKSYLDKIPDGKSETVQELRDNLAKTRDADTTCPMSTGIFVRIVAECALEDLAQGEKDVTPFWRVVDPKSPLAKKLSCGPDWIRERRAMEGI